MKRLFILIILLLLLVSCTPIQAEPEPVIETVIVTETVIETVVETIEDTEKIEELQEKLKQYKDLVNNLNQLLSNVYYVYQKKDDGSSIWGTGFSIEYKSNYYLITAGHIVNGDYGIFKNLGFRNYKDEWIYPKLLTYENEFQYGKDYAIFYSDKISNGFLVGEYLLPTYILGCNRLNTIKGGTAKTVEGESGSPVINKNGEIIGIMTGSFTDITYILQAIDNSE